MEGMPQEPSNEYTPTQIDLEALSYEELVLIYKDRVGVNPLLRMFAEEVLRNGINNPEEELARLRELDKEEDNEDLADSYRP